METEAFIAEACEQVSHAVVSVNVVSVPFAAGGVIAEFINSLHAKRAGNFTRNNRDTEPVRGCGAEDLGLHDGVYPILNGGHRCHPSTGVWLSDAHQTFLFTFVGCALDKFSVKLLVELIRSFLLRTSRGRQHNRWEGP